MAAPLVFISHSTNGDNAAKAVLTELVAALEGSCQLLYDHDSLQPGESWRSAINVWVGTCDAAIILVTKKALTSAYCRYEWNILSYRRKTSGKLLVIPIFYDVDPELLVHDPAQLNEIQGMQERLDHTSGADTAAKVLNALKGLPTAHKPTETQAILIGKLLEDNLGKLAVLANAIANVGVDLHLGAWEPFSDEWHRYALRVMGLGLGQAAPVLRQVRAHFKPPTRDWSNLLELVACSWVDNRAAGVVKVRSTGPQTERAISLNARAPKTARLYALSASGRLPVDPWCVAEVNGVVDDYSQLEEELELALANALRLGPDATAEDVQNALKSREKNREPVLACLPGDGFDPSWLPDVRKRFPSITLFFLNGVDAEGGLGDPSVERLVPDLEPSFETNFWEDYDDRIKYLNDDLPKGQ